MKLDKVHKRFFCIYISYLNFFKVLKKFFKKIFSKKIFLKLGIKLIVLGF